MAWKKKVLKKYFDKVEIYELFQCIVYWLLQAPTVEITRMLQWLSEVREARHLLGSMTHGLVRAATIQTLQQGTSVTICQPASRQIGGT
jgi:hypothetical protein